MEKAFKKNSKENKPKRLKQLNEKKNDILMIKNSNEKKK